MSLDTRSVVLGLAVALGVASLATLARVSIFFAQFDASWPAMFCYGPEGAVMFESVAGIPLLAASVACALAVGQGRAGSFATVPLAITAVSVCSFLLFRVWQLVQTLAGGHYDEGCGRLAAWAWQYPLLNLVTRPISALVVCTVAAFGVAIVMYGAVRSRIA